MSDDLRSSIFLSTIVPPFVVTPAEGEGYEPDGNLHFVQGDLFRSPASVLVNPCNTVGVAGGGLSLAFAKRYPLSIQEYKTMCHMESLRVGGMPQLSALEHGKMVLHFPTKGDFRYDSELDWIEQSLFQLSDAMMYNWPPSSFAFPLLGCGLGGLDKSDVIPLFRKYMSKTPSIILLYIRSLVL